MMRKHDVRHLPVLSGGRLIGLLSLRDLHLIETLTDSLPDEVTVEEAMSPDPFSVSPDAPVDEVAQVMAQKRYGSAVVIDGNQVVGVFTAIDGLRALAEVLRDPEAQPD
jgi:acetoin utilization protein AcuB